MMKRILLMAIGLLCCAQVGWAQSLIIGDMDGNGMLNMTDVTSLLNTILGVKEQKTISDLSVVDNSAIVGTWYKTKSIKIVFDTTGTTDYEGGYRYEYLPFKGNVMLYDAEGKIAKVLSVLKINNEQLVMGVEGSGVYTTYYRTQPAQPVTSIQLSDTILKIAPNSFKTLTATILPEDADNKNLIWSSSNESVAKVTSDGVVLALAYGKATITATAADSSNVVGKCEVSVVVDPLSYKTYTVNGVSFNMVPVEGGTFQMGGTLEQGEDVEDNEIPTHSVTLSDYAIGETEVTQALWYAVMGTKPALYTWSKSYGLGDNYPAYYISYGMCQDFITKLNALTGETFRMPTEAEWEYAARGGAKSKGFKFAGGNTINDVAWNYYNSYVKGSGSSEYGSHAVATKAPNELGLYDMSGNVEEWCSDWYGSYSSDAQKNPTGPNTGTYRVCRGGIWSQADIHCRVSKRLCDSPGSRTWGNGLRLAR